jgi:hypothetical protein
VLTATKILFPRHASLRCAPAGVQDPIAQDRWYASRPPRHQRDYSNDDELIDIMERRALALDAEDLDERP